MEMKVHLHSDVFDIVKNGKKDIEVRINDEKRRQLKIGDTLVFLRRPNDDEEIRAKVVGLEYYDYFDNLVDHYDMERIYLSGYTKEEYLNEYQSMLSTGVEEYNTAIANLQYEKVRLETSIADARSIADAAIAANKRAYEIQ